MSGYFRKLFHPASLFIFVILVAVMASSTNLGTDGITYAVVISAVVLMAGAGLTSVGYRKFQDMLDGKPNLLDHMAAPNGYRRARLAETEEEQVRNSHVRPTPNRPLTVDADEMETLQPRSVVPATPTAVAKYSESDRFLNLAEDCKPPVNMVIGSSVTFFGIRGSGKTTALALFLEQLLRFPLAALIGDVRQDYQSLPSVIARCVIAGAPDYPGQSRYKTYWKVNRGSAKKLGYEIMKQQGRVVLLLNTFEDPNEAAYVMAEIIAGMFAWADSQDEGDRYPAIVALDEAESMIPQNPKAAEMEPEAVATLLRAIRKVNSQGRSSGLTPVIATQRPANIDKTAIAGTEIWFLGKQTNPRDLDYYKDILGTDEYRANVMQFDKGDFLVNEGGETYPIHFYQRRSEHRNSTPTLTSAIKLSQRQAAQLTAEYGIDHEEEVNTDDLPELAEQGYEEFAERHTDQARSIRPPAPQNQDAQFVGRGADAYLEGATSQPKLAAALNIELWDARKLMPRVLLEVQRRKREFERQEQE